ncbi:MAG: YXWGXW repeat-containing protein [Candidatus Eremiobacteraeota bacterium]|nr:YXWGXW repeat-containing protein [Candidatus Eremiobacteraeota bacterium]
MGLLNYARAAVVTALFISVPIASSAQISVGIGVNIGPPPIPVYVQPPAPVANYIWEPGYWAWGPGGYYWVPGTWVAPPTLGLYWTPGYWGWGSGAYYWHRGYWGPVVGFYGGINYGFGYYGTGYVGGRWYGNTFRYNVAVTNVNRTVIRNVYVDKTVIREDNHVHISYNGGHGGITAQPTHDEIVARERGEAPTTEQRYHQELASQDRNHLSTVNGGHPNTTAVEHPYSATHQPAHVAPVTNADRAAAKQHETASQGNKPPL